MRFTRSEGVLAGGMLLTLAVYFAMAPLEFSILFFSLPPALVFAFPLAQAVLTARAAARRAPEGMPLRGEFHRVLHPRIAGWAVLWCAFFAVWEAGAGMVFHDMNVLGTVSCLLVLAWTVALCLVLAPRFRRPFPLALLLVLAGPSAVGLFWFLVFCLLAGLKTAGLWDSGYMDMGLIFGPPIFTALAGPVVLPCAWLWTRVRGDAWFGPRPPAQEEEAPEAGEMSPRPGKQPNWLLLCVIALAAAAPLALWSAAGAGSFKRLGSFGDHGTVVDTVVAGNCVYGLMGDGRVLEVYTVAPGTGAVTRASTLKLPGQGLSMALTGNLLCLSDWGGTAIVDVSDPAAPRLTARYAPPGKPPLRVAAAGNLMFGGNVGGLLSVTDISDPAAPVQVGTFDRENAGDYSRSRPDSETSGLAVRGSLLLCACGSAGLRIYDVADPAHPAFLGAFVPEGRLVLGVDVSGDTAVLATNYYGGRSRVMTVNIKEPAFPVLLGSLDTGGAANDVRVTGSLAYVALNGSGMGVVDISNPRAPRLVDTYRPLLRGNLQIAFARVGADGSLAAVANRNRMYGGLHIVRRAGPAGGTAAPASGHKARPPQPPPKTPPRTPPAPAAPATPPAASSPPGPSGDASFTLGDYRGKYVLLDFWAAWCGPCREEMPTVRAAREAYRNDARLVFVGMNLDPKPEDGRRYAEKNGLDWRQVWLGDWNASPVPARHHVTGIPCLILFSPEGKEIARDMRGAETAATLLRFLGPPEHPPARATAPAASSDTATVVPPPSSRPAVIVPSEDGKTLVVNVDRDFEYVPEGFPMGLSVGQTDASALFDEPPEKLVAEPAYRAAQVMYGYLTLGNAPDNRHVFAVDDMDRSTWTGYFDGNNNEDLTDDGPPVIISANVSFLVDMVGPSGERFRRPYRIWEWGGMEGDRPFVRFYSFCHHRAQARLGNTTVTAVVFERFHHDALYADDGVFLDLNRDGRLDEEGEFFKDGAEVSAGGARVRLKLAHP